MLNPHEKLEELCELSDSVREYINNELYRVIDDSKEMEFTTQDLVNNSIEFIVKELREFGIFIDLDPIDYIEEWSYAEGIITLRKFFDKDIFESILLSTSLDNLKFLKVMCSNIELDISSFLYECIDIFSDRNIGESTFISNIDRVIEHCYSTEDFKEYIEFMCDTVIIKKNSNQDTNDVLKNIKFCRMVLDYISKPFSTIFAQLNNSKDDIGIPGEYAALYVRNWLMPDEVSTYRNSLLTDTVHTTKLPHIYTLKYTKTFVCPTDIDTYDIIAMLSHLGLIIHLANKCNSNYNKDTEEFTYSRDAYRLVTLEKFMYTKQDVTADINAIMEHLKHVNRNDLVELMENTYIPRMQQLKLIKVTDE